jgi:hypothetical protein
MVSWLVVAVVTWPLLALVVGLLLGRGIAGAEANEPRLPMGYWLRRERAADASPPRSPQTVKHI